VSFVIAGHISSRQRLRAILQGDRCVQMISIYDPVSMRIAQDLRCEAGLMGGSLVSLAVLGAPDLILITLTELAEQVRRCTRAGTVPLVVDGNHGYGNALNVMRTVEELDMAGAAAVTIEDTLLPRAFDSSNTPRLLTLEEGAGKLRAAVTARGDSGLLVFGRSSAPAWSGLDEAIARLVAYEATGIDALMIPGVRSRGDLGRICGATHLPLVLGGLTREMHDIDHLSARRVRLSNGGHQTLNVAIGALHAAMKAVHEGMFPADLDGTAGKETMNMVSGTNEYDERIRSFLAGP
jgi:carboxyvinyl-carboxyphosphonate phosphorylmutase